MKILILNGSPRNQGLISQMLDIMTEEARIRGAEVEVIPIRKLQVHPVQDAWLAAADRPVSYPKTTRSTRFKRYNGQTC